MKEEFCDTCGGTFWQAKDETTCVPCQNAPKPKATVKLEVPEPKK